MDFLLLFVILFVDVWQILSSYKSRWLSLQKDINLFNVLVNSRCIDGFENK